MDDRTLILADMACKAMRHVHDGVAELLRANGMDADRAGSVAETLTSGQWTHDYPITLDQAEVIGLPVQEALPETIYRLMELYPQETQRRPSMEYIPLPCRREPTAPGNEGCGT